MSLVQLSRLLPLPEPDLQQVLEYAATLSKQDAADHFNNLLGESPQSIEFISSFNSRRQDPASAPKPQAVQVSNDGSGVPKSTRKQPKKKTALHTPAPRQIRDTYAAPGTAYKKKDEDDYVSKKQPRSISRPPTSNAFTLQAKPVAVQASVPRPPPSAAGSLISDFKTSKSTPTSRTSSPTPSKTKVNISGGTSMHGATTVLSEFDAAIRSLEISTNSSLLLPAAQRACNCIGARHPLLTAAPNCLNCGKVICVKEGLGPCTFCGEPLLSAVEIQGMIHELREERGREKMLLDNSSNRRAEVSKKPLPFTTPRNLDMSPAELAAKEHRDKLLGFQAQNAKRTTVRDEASDFETPLTARGDVWASPAERARQLKRQQKVLAEQEWNARPEYEKRRQVLSIGFEKGKVVKRMGVAAVDREKPQAEERGEEEEIEEELPLSDTSGNKGRGTFSRNPLLGGLIKPVYNSGKGKEVDSGAEELRRKTWRRVQDSLEDNEAIILDGGVFGGVASDRVEQEEPACG